MTRILPVSRLSCALRFFPQRKWPRKLVQTTQFRNRSIRGPFVEYFETARHGYAGLTSGSKSVRKLRLSRLLGQERTQISSTGPVALASSVTKSTMGGDYRRI